jgi:hypothetical protein
MPDDSIIVSPIPEVEYHAESPHTCHIRINGYTARGTLTFTKDGNKWPFSFEVDQLSGPHSDLMGQTLVGNYNPKQKKGHATIQVCF